MPENFTPVYSPWRHGGWYVDNVRYPSGAVGCVSRNYPDRKWRIVCDSRKDAPTYSSRDAAARAEKDLASYVPINGAWSTGRPCPICGTETGRACIDGHVHAGRDTFNPALYKEPWQAIRPAS